MASSFAYEKTVKTSRRVYSGDTDDHGPLELVWPGEDDGRDIREQLEDVLERCLNRRESPTVVRLNFLLVCQFTSLVTKQTKSL